MQNLEKKTKCVPTLILLHRNLEIIPPASFPASIKPRWELIFCRFKDSRATSSTSPDTSQKRRAAHLGVSRGVSGWLGNDQPLEIERTKMLLVFLVGWETNWQNMGVSKNGGTPKWMVYNGKPY